MEAADLSTSNKVEKASFTEVAPQNINSFLIKTCDYRFQVKDVEKSTKSIEKIAANYQAVISGMDITTSNYEITNNLVIRVASNKFEAVLEDLAKESVFTDFKRITTEDISEEFVDIQTRLQTKKEVRDRYNDILKNKAKTVDDVLKAEEKIRILQEEIEAKEGRLKYLQNRVALSTINLTIYQKVDFKESPSVYEKPYFAKVRDSFVSGWSLVTGLILVLANIWPLLLIGIVIYWRRNWIKKKITRKQ